MSVRVKEKGRKRMRFHVTKKDLDLLNAYVESVTCLGA